MRTELSVATLGLQQKLVTKTVKSQQPYFEAEFHNRIRPSPADAPNIDVTSPLEVLYWIGAESLWRAINGIPEGESPTKYVVSFPIDEVYAIKRMVAAEFERTRSK